jgi:phage-related tail fiber protein
MAKFGLIESPRVTNLAAPTAASDAANKAYVDAAIQGFTVKSPVRAATTVNITLSGLQTIDGVVLAANDRVLVKDQTTGSQNGIYLASSTSWVRSEDADAGTELSSAVFVFVSEGTANADFGWVLTTDTPITIGTTALDFVQFTGLGQVVAGAGLTKSGNQLSVGGNARIVVNADDVDLATSGVTAGTYNSVTVDIYGRVTAATVQAYGKVARSTFTNSNLSSGILTLAHNLGQQFSQVTVFDNSNKIIIPDDITATDSNNCEIDLSDFGTITGTWTVVVCG